MNNDLAIFVVILTVGLFALFLGGFTQTSIYHRKCETLYSDMPANKVVEHCNKILKFEKDSK